MAHTPYSKGFAAGLLYGRKQALEYLNAKYDHGEMVLHLEELIDELQRVHEQDKELGLYGNLASVKRMAKSESLCEDCFGTDLCIVCERTSR